MTRCGHAVGALEAGDCRRSVWWLPLLVCFVTSGLDDRRPACKSHSSLVRPAVVGSAWFCAEFRRQFRVSGYGFGRRRAPCRIVGPTCVDLDMVPRAGRVIVESGKPLRFEDSEFSPQELSASDVGGASDAIGKTFRAYLKALKELLATRYSHAADTVPAYMKAPCQVTVLRCTDALFVRYDIVDEDDKAKVRVVNTAQPVETVAPAFSDAVVHAPSDPTKWTPSAEGPKLAMSITDPTGAATREIMSFSPAIVISPRWPEGVTYPAPPTRPSPVASLLNEFDFEISGIIEDASPAAPREVRTEPTHFTV